jgi:NAD-specific glutamate dehydrogenase
MNQNSELIDDVISAYQPGVDALKSVVADIASPFDLKGVETPGEQYREGGAPEDLALGCGALRPLTSSSDVIDLAHRKNWPLEAPPGFITGSAPASALTACGRLGASCPRACIGTGWPCAG